MRESRFRQIVPSHKAPGPGPVSAVRRHTPGSDRRGYSLVFVMIVLMSFIAIYPLLFQQLETSQRRTTSIYAWSKIQGAAESGLNMAKYAYSTDGTPAAISLSGVIASVTYPISAGATLAIGISYRAFPAGNSIFASATAYVETSLGASREPSGFDGLTVSASFTWDAVTGATTTRWLATASYAP